MVSLCLNGDISLCTYLEKVDMKDFPDDLLHDYDAVKTALLNSLEDTPSNAGCRWWTLARHLARHTTHFICGFMLPICIDRIMQMVDKL